MLHTFVSILSIEIHIFLSWHPLLIFFSLFLTVIFFRKNALTATLNIFPTLYFLYPREFIK